jgi:ATP-dependent RNA helicase HelY
MSHLDPLALEAKLGLRLNDMQKQALPALLSSKNVLVCAPTSSGKSVLFELAVLTRSAGQRFVYLAPVKSLVQQQFHSWSKKHSDLRIAEMTSDCDQTSLDYDLILATPEKWRAKGDVRCLLLDELHLVNAEGRGGSL